MFLLLFLDFLNEVSVDAEQNKETQYMVHKSYLDVEYDSQWQPARVHRIHNPQLESEYEGNVDQVRHVTRFIIVSHLVVMVVGKRVLAYEIHVVLKFIN